jgi:hypothetical protein
MIFSLCEILMAREGSKLDGLLLEEAIFTWALKFGTLPSCKQHCQTRFVLLNNHTAAIYGNTE